MKLLLAILFSAFSCLGSTISTGNISGMNSAWSWVPPVAYTNQFDVTPANNTVMGYVLHASFPPTTWGTAVQSYVQFPYGYDPNVARTNPLAYTIVLFCHGYSEYGFTDLPVSGPSGDNTPGLPIFTNFIPTLLSNNCYVLSCYGGMGWTGYPGTFENWGNTITSNGASYGWATYTNLLCAALGNLPSHGKVVVLSLSMGGLNGLPTLNIPYMTNVCGWYGVDPVCDLWWMSGTVTYSNLIAIAYNLPGLVVPNPLTAIIPYITNNNPVWFPSSYWPAIRYRFDTSSNDVTVIQSSNSFVIQSDVTNVALECQRFDHSGGHADVTGWNPAHAWDFMAFIYRSIATNITITGSNWIGGMYGAQISANVSLPNGTVKSISWTNYFIGSGTVSP